MKVKFKFAPGEKVVDIVAGVEGIITASSVVLQGYNQHHIQPKSTDKSAMPDAWLIDDCQLEEMLTGAETMDIPKVYEVDFKYHPGQKGIDSVSGIKGKIIRAIYYINGCIVYSLQPKAAKGKVILPRTVQVSEDFFELTKEAKEPKPSTEKTPRGPSERQISQKA